MPPPDRKTADDYHYHAYDFKDSVAWEPGPAQNDRNKYKFYSMVKDLNGLKNTGTTNGVPNIKLAIGAKQTAGGRDTMVLEFGNAGLISGRPTVVITGGIHSNEWIAHEMAYLLAEYLIMHYRTDPKGDYQKAIHDLIDSRNIRIIPMVNPDGNDRTVFGGDTVDGLAREWRKNLRALPATGEKWVTELTTSSKPNPPFDKVGLSSGLGSDAVYDVPDYEPKKDIPPKSPPNYRPHKLANGKTGVDPNRNWATRAWGYDDAEQPSDWDPSGRTYFGPKRASEAETANIGDYLGITVGFGVAIDYHSYGRNIVYPSEAYNRGEVGADYKHIGKVLEGLIKSQDGQQYKLDTSVGSVGYDTTGATDDYMAYQYRAQAFTIELDPKEDDPGFLLPEKKIKDCFETNIRGALAAIAAPGPTTNVKEIDNAVKKFLAWNVYGLGNQLPG